MAEPYSKSPGAPLRVLQIASGDLWAGAEVQLFNLCEQLQRSEQVDLSVVLLNEGQLANRLRDTGVLVTVYDEAGMSFWQIYTGLVKHCRMLNPHIMHSHRQKENVLTALCGLRTRIPSIRTAHGAPEFNFHSFSSKNLVALVDRWVGRFLQRRVVAVSDDLAKKLAMQYPAAHIAVIRNGIALSEPIAEAPANLAADHTHIGIVGRLVSVKRIDLFLETAAILIANETDQRFRFWIIGDGPLRGASEAQAQSLGIADRIEFIGHVPSAMPYLRALDLLLMCSDHEGTPMTLLEAMRCELPVVAHDVGGLRELLSNPASNAAARAAPSDTPSDAPREVRCGYLVAQHTPAAYAAAIAEVLQSSELKETFARDGIARLNADYSAEKNTQDYLALYRQILSG